MRLQLIISEGIMEVFDGKFIRLFKLQRLVYANSGFKFNSISLRISTRLSILKLQKREIPVDADV